MQQSAEEMKNAFRPFLRPYPHPPPPHSHHLGDHGTLKLFKFNLTVICGHLYRAVRRSSLSSKSFWGVFCVPTDKPIKSGPSRDPPVEMDALGD